MSLSIPDPIPIEPLTQERPRGSPCGAQAYTTRLTAESFDAIKTALLVQEQARTIERDLSAKKGIPWATSKNEKHVVQLVVDANGKTSMLVGDKTFPVTALQERKGLEIVARQTTPTHCDSDTGEIIPEHSSLHTIAQVVGRFQVSRFLDDNNAAQVREYTKKHEKERNSTIVLGNDEYMAQQHRRSTVKVEATQAPGSTATSQAAPISFSNARSTKQSQASASSAAPYLPVPDAEVPPDFKSLSLTIPRTWEPENISLPLRTIHVMALNKHTEADISAEIEKYTGQKPPSDELHGILTRIAIRDPSTGQWALREPAYLYVRPFDYPDYDRSDRPAAARFTRPKLRALGYPDEGPRFEVLRRSTVLATPTVASLPIAPSENPGGVTTAHRTVDFEAAKRAAESNPAPTLKSDVRQGFFSSSTGTKKKKTTKTKEPKEPKEPKESKPKKTKTKRDHPDMKPRAPRENEPSPAPAALPSKATPKLEPEPYIDPKAPVVRAQSRPGPGSAAGKLAAKKRLAEEAVMKEKAVLAEGTQPPIPKSTPSSKSAPPTARSSPASAPLKPSLKRKSASDSSESPPKRRRVEMEEGEIDEAALPAAGKGKAKAAQRDDDDDEYDNFVAQSMKKRRSVSDDEKPPPRTASVKKPDDAGLRAPSKTKKQVVDDEYEDVKPARKKATAASASTAAKRRPVKEEDEYSSKSASQRSVRWNTEVEEKSAAGIKKRKLVVTQEDDADYDDQRPKKKKKTVKAEPLESVTSSRPKQRASKDDEYDIKGRLERARGTMPGAKRKADADPVAAIASPPLKLLKSDEVLSQKAAKQSLRVAKAESPRVQPLKQPSAPAQPSSLRNLVASSVVEETKKTRKIKPEGAKPYAASPSGQLVRHPATRITNGKASASPAPVVTAVQCSVDGKKIIPPPPPEPAADHATTVMNVINRQVPNTLEDLQSKFEELIQVDKALRIFLDFDQRELKEKRSASGVLKPRAASLFQKIKRMYELRHKLTMETQKVAHALQQLGGINDANPVTTRQPVPRPDSPDDVISTRQRNLPVPEGITEEMEARHAESKQRWVEAQALNYSSQPTTPHRTPLLLPSSVSVRSPTLVPPPPASVPGPSNCIPSSTTNTSPPIHAPARVSVTLQESPTQSTPPAGTHPENKQSFQEVKTESKAFRRFRKVAPSASATPGAPGTPTVAGLQSQQTMAYNNSSPSGSGLPASAATPVTAPTPTPVANAATPAATAPTPGVAPSPVIPTVAVFSPVA